MRSSFQLSAIPYSLAYPDGTLRKATKSVLLAELKQTVNVEPRLPKTNNAPSTAHIDGMAQVQMLKSGVFLQVPEYIVLLLFVRQCGLVIFWS